MKRNNLYIKIVTFIFLFLILYSDNVVFSKNVIIIGIDALSRGHISYFGYNRNTTPNLDIFAKHSIVFYHAYSPSSWTLPVFMSWFTSVYPSQHKLTNKYYINNGKLELVSLDKLAPNIITLAQVLKKYGFKTAGFTGGAALGGKYGYSKGFDIYFDKINFGTFRRTFRLALTWIKKNKDTPFFVFIHGYDVHPMSKLSKQFDIRRFWEEKIFFNNRESMKQYEKYREDTIDGKIIDISDEEKLFWQSWYDERIYNMDQLLGQFLSNLKKLDILNNTLIIIGSDHGTEFGERGKFGHGYSLNEDLIHVPLFMAIPHINHKDIFNLVSTLDIVPTVLDWLDIEDERMKLQMEGESLLDIIDHKVEHKGVFSETDFLLITSQRSVVTPDMWQLILSLEEEEAVLYRLEDKASERKNLFFHFPEKAMDLEVLLYKWMRHLE